jgi:hypothetical protein
MVGHVDPTAEATVALSHDSGLQMGCHRRSKVIISAHQQHDEGAKNLLDYRWVLLGIIGLKYLGLNKFLASNVRMSVDNLGLNIVFK